MIYCEPAWPGGNGLVGRTQVRLPASAQLSLRDIVIYGHCLVALPFTINETLKWLDHITAHLNAEIILVVTVGLLDIISLSHLLSYCRYHFCEPDVKLD